MSIISTIPAKFPKAYKAFEDYESANPTVRNDGDILYEETGFYGFFRTIKNKNIKACLKIYEEADSFDAIASITYILFSKLEEHLKEKQ